MISRTRIACVLGCALALSGLASPVAAQDDAASAPVPPPVPDEAAVAMTDALSDAPAPEPPPEEEESTSFANFLQQNVAIHGFGTWGMGITGTPDGHAYGFNEFQFGQHKGEFSQTQFALREIVQATPEIRLAAGQSFRASVDNGIFLELDLASAEWTPVPEFSIRAGRILTPLGFYTQNYRVGTMRPFAVLPQSVYGLGGVVAQYYDGLGLTYRAETGRGWRMRLELFAGHMFLPLDPAIYVTTDALLGNPYKPDRYVNAGTDLAFQGGGALWVDAPVEGLTFMAGAFAAPARMVDRNSDHSQTGWYASVSAVAGIAYITDRLEIRSEVSLRASPYQGKSGSIGNGYGGYIEVAYRILESLQLAVRGDYVRSILDDSFVALGNWDTTLQHADAGVSLNYWFNRDLVVKLSYQYIHGNRFAHPTNQDMYNEITSSIAALDFSAHFQQTTHYGALVTSFSF